MTDVALVQTVSEKMEAYQELHETLPEAMDVTHTWVGSGDYACFEGFLIDSSDGICNADGDAKSAASVPADPSAVTNGENPTNGTKIGGLSVTNSTNAFTGEEVPMFSFLYNSSNAYSVLGMQSYLFDAMIGGDDVTLKASAASLPVKPKTEEEKQEEKKTQDLYK